MPIRLRGLFCYMLPNKCWLRSAGSYNGCVTKQLIFVVLLLAATGAVAAIWAVRGWDASSPLDNSEPLIDSGNEETESPQPAATPTIHSPELKSFALPDFQRHQRSGQPQPLFENIPSAESGVDAAFSIDRQHPMQRLYVSGFACGGIAVGDVDGDGLVDLFVAGTHDPNRLYRQHSPLKFEDVSDMAGINETNHWGSAAAMIDLDGDADLDIYVCNYDSPNQLFLNDGQGAFTESAKSFGLDVTDASLMPYFCDYDIDGDLDLFLLTNRFYREGGLPTTPTAEVVDGRPRLLPQYEKYYQLVEVSPGKMVTNLVPRRDRLFRCERSADGSATYKDVSDSAGITAVGHGLSAIWWDYDEDGLPDLYVCNDYDDPDHLYHNNGDGTFHDVIADVMPHTPWFSMGSDAADVDGDGRLDLLVADMSATTHYKSKTTMRAMNNQRILSVSGPPPQLMRNALLLNTGIGRFREAAYLANLANTDWTWAVKFGDLDNDGRNDLYVTNGMTRSFNDSDVRFNRQMVVGRTEWDIYADRPTRKEQNLVYRNDGDVQFTEVAHNWGLDHNGMSFAATLVDLDRDGDLDIVTANLDEPISIYRNRGTKGNRVVVSLSADEGNRFGLGAKVEITAGGAKHVRRINPFTGFKSSGDYDLHFGLGEADRIERIQVQWPDGQAQTFDDLPVNRRYVVTRSSVKGDPHDQPRSESPPLYRQTRGLFADAVHREDAFDDFARQPLLPNKLSIAGPGAAWGDVDGDGDEDFFLGQGAGHAGALFVRNQQGTFDRRTSPAMIFDSACEDMGALFFDADADGDLDLYVASGGVECEPGDGKLRDRLYLNDGSGNFSKAPDEALPEVRDSSSVVAAADFDRDGDLDLFVGGRVIPGQYPLAPSSRLLRNEGGKFADVTEQIAPQLLKTGLVTSAVWSDANDDGWIDLLVTHEWGPVKLFENNEGKLRDQTGRARLADHLGWWNGIAAGDLDRDGDTDYVVTNFGLNTKYHASSEKPALLYYGDFEDKGRMRLVEAEYEDETLYPIRGRSCTTHAMPHLGETFKSYHAFAAASLEGVFTQQCLDKAHRFAATELRTGVLRNDGNARFTFEPLPRIAQIAPSFGAAILDANFDGHADIILAQNFFGPQLETGPMDGGLGQLLLGDGDGNFDPAPPERSGIVVPGDARGVTVCDLNGDNLPDVILALNQDSPQVFLANRRAIADDAGTILQARFVSGDASNLQAIGAKATFVHEDGTRQSCEVGLGSGYLSQSPAVISVPVNSANKIESVEVRWPDGQQTEHEFLADASSITIEQP